MEALHQRTQAPLPICGNAVLALAALAVQPYADIVLPIGVRHPLSLFLITVAESGDRKSTVDDLVLELVRAHEAELAADYEIKMFKYSCEYGTWKRAQDQILKSSSDRQTKQKELQDLGPEPARPWYPMRICNEPTFEGLVRALDEGWPSMGVFSDEGAQFIAGHAMSEDHRLKTAAAFCDLWAGNTIRRVRAGTGLQMFAGRRVSLHLMIQPLVARRLFADPVLRDQGLLSRLLTVMPASAAGTRLSSNNNADNFHNFQNFHKVLGPILRKWMPIKEAKTINPRALPLSEVANKLFFKYADDVETRLKAGVIMSASKAWLTSCRSMPHG